MSRISYFEEEATVTETVRQELLRIISQKIEEAPEHSTLFVPFSEITSLASLDDRHQAMVIKQLESYRGVAIDDADHLIPHYFKLHILVVSTRIEVLLYTEWDQDQDVPDPSA